MRFLRASIAYLNGLLSNRASISSRDSRAIAEVNEELGRFQSLRDSDLEDLIKTSRFMRPLAAHANRI